MWLPGLKVCATIKWPAWLTSMAVLHSNLQANYLLKYKWYITTGSHGSNPSTFIYILEDLLCLVNPVLVHARDRNLDVRNLRQQMLRFRDYHSVKHNVHPTGTTPVVPVPLQVCMRAGNWAWRLKNTGTDTERDTHRHGSFLIQECQVYCAPGKLI